MALLVLPAGNGRACQWKNARVSAARVPSPGVKRSLSVKLEVPTRNENRHPDAIPVTVKDAIRMTRIAGLRAMLHTGGGSTENFASYSLDGKRFALVTKKGNLQRNANDYSLLVYTAGEVFSHPRPRTLVSFASSSNRAAIDDVSWRGDNNTILFLGERPGETTQLYSIECNSGRVRRLTNHPTNLLAYSAAERGRRIVYVAEAPVSQLTNENVRRNGLHVSREALHELLAGRAKNGMDSELFVLETAGKSLKRLEIRDRFSAAPLFLSPDGRYLVVQTNVTELPPFWSEYQDKQGYLQRIFRLNVPRGAPTWIRRYQLVDTETGESQVLLNAPVSHWTGSEVLWLPDSQSVVLSGVYLPLDVPESAEREIRKKTAFTVELKVPSLEIAKITDSNLKILGWDEQAQLLMLESRDRAPFRVECYQRNGNGWEAARAVAHCGYPSRPEILSEQNLNTAPRVVAFNRRTGQKAVLLDLNPQFANLVFGKVEAINWPVGDSREVEGGLYLPPNYVPGGKYPLVIQTHGFDPHEFWIDGPFSTANAAQPLASKGIVVLQVPDESNFAFSGTPEEAPRMMRSYEGAMEYLAGKGIVDLKHVGLIGFSHTCWLVEYALTHSKYQFAAAVVADGMDGGYFQYMAFANQTELTESYREKIIGALPFGDGLSLWLKRSPGFLLDRVRTPILIQAIGRYSLLEEWEWFAGLSRLNKPVDLVYLPDGLHILQKPWERMVSQQGDVDWFCFWLKGEEDDDPAKADQYVRWRQLRNRMQQDSKSGLPLSSPLGKEIAR